MTTADTEDPVIESNRQSAEGARIAATFDEMSNAEFLATRRKARIELPMNEGACAWREAVEAQFQQRLLALLEEFANR